MKNKITIILTSLLLLSSCKSSNIVCNECKVDISNSSALYQTLYGYCNNDNLKVYEISEITNDYFISRAILDNDIHNVYSITKNFTATCIGILIDENKLSLDDTIYDIFKDEYTMDSIWKNVTIKNVLTQTTGIENGFLDIDNEDSSLYPTDDYLQIVLDTIPQYTPGTHFVYSDSNYYLLARVINKKSNTTYQKFIKEKLFKPLNITNYEITCDPKGYPMGATGLKITSRDFIKLAWMYLNNGIYDNQQILSQSYVSKALSDSVDVDEHTKYSYSFWLDEGYNHFRGSGMLGQSFIADYTTKSVIGWSAYDNGTMINELLEEVLSN